MQLKRLEAYGFKSFADKVVIEFDKGVTAIVGPNGSGKSNITDAIRWVLGEQNVRNLRAGKAEDIIFAGSAARKPLGVAEVSLVFDNTDGTLPVDFAEVVVTRRLYRSGESEVYLNKSRCRIKDIYQLFADTGIGHEGMSVIGQNRIDDILNSRPEERRAFFEETAGITKYKARKKEALKKLDDTEKNLVRVGDIQQEIESQLGPLAAHAERTRTYQELEGTYKKCRLTSLSQQHESLTSKRTQAEAERQGAETEKTAAETAARTAEAEKERTQAAIVAIEQSMQKEGEKGAALQKQVDSVTAELATLRERTENSASVRERLAARKTAITQELVRAAGDIGRLTETVAKGKKDAAAADERIEQERAKLQDIKNRVSEARKKAESLNDDAEKLQNQLTEQQQAIAVLEKDIELGGEGKREREKALGAAKERLAALQKERDACAEKLAVCEQERDACLKAGNDNAIAMRTAQNALEAAQEARETAARAAKRTADKLQILRHMQQSYEGFGRAVRAVLKSTAPWHKGVAGAVAELLTVPEKYVTALSTALAGSQQHIVTEDTDTAKAAIGYLKAQKLGRATFLPLSTIQVRQPSDADAVRSMTGAVGWANELVTTDAKYRRVADHLLARTLVVDTLDHALTIARETRYRLRIVTLDGELLSPGGSLTGGSRGHKEGSYLGRQGEIAALEKEQAAAAKETAARQQEEDDARAAYSTCQRKAEDLEKRLQQANVEMAELRVARKKAEEAASEQEAALAEQKQQHVAAETSFAKAQKQRSEAREAARATQEALEKAQKACAVQQEDIDDLLEDADDLEALLHDRETKRAVLTVQCERDADLLQSKKEEKTKREQELAGVEQETEDQKALEATSAERLAALEEEEGRLAEQQMELRTAHDRLYAEKMDKMVAAQDIEKTIKKHAREAARLTDKLHAAELAVSKAQFAIDECERAMFSDYGLTAERAAEEALDLPPEELQPKMQELEEKMKALGPINPNAVTEYEELKKRHDFMEAQTEDLRKARANLETLLAEMDATMTKQFGEAFAKIQEYFQESFTKLFGGGKAELKLLDENDMLASGIDILVTLPKKKRQNLSALSGGERALTVIALLFACLHYKPSPFSVLDEIDAPLDEANVVRFGHYLRELAYRTQFIVVTHRKGTMENVDVLYGVTTEDAGVSKILSVKLSDYID